MLQRRKVWIAGLGAGLELLFAAAVALGAPRIVWAAPLVAGAVLIVVAILIGEPADSEQIASEPLVDGGGGDGPVRGVVFGDHATLNINHPAPSSAPVSERSMVRVSIADLLNLYKEHTQVQAERLIEPYIGGWINVRGVVEDVVRKELEEGHYVSIQVDGTGDTVVAEFPDSAQDQLPRLLRGNSLEVVGRISKVNLGWVGLVDCEFVD